MPGSTPTYGFKYAQAADETKAFPAEVDEPKTKSIEKVIEEHTLTIKKRAAGYTAASGEWGIQEKTGETTTLPAATANALVGVTCKVAGGCKVTTSGGAFIIGSAGTTIFPEASKMATVTLTEGDHLLVIADGTNWNIVTGDVKQEQKYAAAKKVTKAEGEAGVEPSATRAAIVTLEITEPALVAVSVGGVALIGNVKEQHVPMTFLVPPGQKWIANLATEASTILL